MRDKSKKQEKKIAQKMGGYEVLASGAFWSHKADVRTDDFLIECKTTDKDYYPLSVKTWEKIRVEAVKDGLRIPLLVVDLEGGEETYVFFRTNDFSMTINDDVRVHPIASSYRIKGEGYCSINDEHHSILTLDNFLYNLEEG